MATKAKRINLRGEADEVRSFKLAATLARMTYSDWVRDRLCRAAAEELRAAGKSVPFEKKRS